LFSLKDKLAIITGGGSGIGRAVARVFARQEAIVHVLDINRDAAATVAREINDHGGHAAAHRCDVTSQQEVLGLFNSIGSVDALVNSAGVSHIGTVENTTEEDFDRVFSVNVKGVYNCLHAAVPIMRKKGGGAIVNLCSVAAWTGLPDRFAYSMSKGAVGAMTLAVARDTVQDHIRCNSISPGRVHTPFVDDFLARNYPGREKEIYDKLAKTQPVGRMGTPEEIATLVLFLCSDEADFITGTDYPIDGGFIKLNTP